MKWITKHKKKEEPFYRENCKAIRQAWNPKCILNPIRLYSNLRNAFLGFASASLRKIDHDKRFLKDKIEEAKHEAYLAKINRKAYK